MNGRKQIFALVLTAILTAHLWAMTASAEERPSPEREMTAVQAVILGVVEGLTEYLPVSSTGHLLLAEKIMKIGENPSYTAEEQQRAKAAADAYTICIQAGAIIAVLGLYFRRVLQMLNGLAGRDPLGRRLLINVITGFIPAAVIGLFCNGIIKEYLFGTWPVVIAWLIGGIAIIMVSMQNRGNAARPALALDELSWKMALLIGFAQCIAMWPGTSRSLVTIVGGVLAGLSLSAAVEFSFLLGVVTLCAATGYDGLKHWQIMAQTFDAQSMAIGVFFAFVAAVVSVKWMVAYLNRHGLAIFGYYRVALALVVSVLLYSKII